MRGAGEGPEGSGKALVPDLATNLGRRQLLVAIGSLPFVAVASWALTACSGGEEASAPAAPAAGPKPAPAAEPKPAPSPQPAPAVEPKPGPVPADALVTEVEAMQRMVEALQYVNHSAKPDQHCSICQFYTPKTADRGTCQLFAQGLVSSGGWCTSWTKKVPT